MKVLTIASILFLCPAVLAQTPPILPFSIFTRDRTTAGVVPPRPETRPATTPASFTPIFVGVIEDENGFLGILQGQTDVTRLKIGDTLVWNRLKIVDLDLTRMLLSDHTSIPIGNDLLNRPHHLPEAPVLAPSNPTTPPNSTTTGRVGRSGNNPIGNNPAGFPTDPNQPNPTNRARGGFGTGAGFGAAGSGY